MQRSRQRGQFWSALGKVGQTALAAQVLSACYRCPPACLAPLAYRKGDTDMKDAVSDFLHGLVARLKAGRSLHGALVELASSQTTPAMRSVVEQLANSIEKGSSFKDALAKHPKLNERMWFL